MRFYIYRSKHRRAFKITLGVSKSRKKRASLFFGRPPSVTLLRPPANCLAGFVLGLLFPFPKSLSCVPRRLFCFETLRRPKRGLETELSWGGPGLRQSIPRESVAPRLFSNSGRERESGLTAVPSSPTAMQEGCCKAGVWGRRAETPR